MRNEFTESQLQEEHDLILEEEMQLQENVRLWENDLADEEEEFLTLTEEV